jgi:hypothetical protein
MVGQVVIQLVLPGHTPRSLTPSSSRSQWHSKRTIMSTSLNQKPPLPFDVFPNAMAPSKPVQVHALGSGWA